MRPARHSYTLLTESPCPWLAANPSTQALASGFSSPSIMQLRPQLTWPSVHDVAGPSGRVAAPWPACSRPQQQCRHRRARQQLIVLAADNDMDWEPPGRSATMPPPPPPPPRPVVRIHLMCVIACIPDACAEPCPCCCCRAGLRRPLLPAATLRSQCSWAVQAFGLSTTVGANCQDACTLLLLGLRRGRLKLHDSESWELNAAPVLLPLCAKPAVCSSSCPSILLPLSFPLFPLQRWGPSPLRISLTSPSSYWATQT